MRGLICLKGVKFLPRMPRTNFADLGVGNFCEGRVLTREQNRFRERNRSLVNKKKQEASNSATFSEVVQIGQERDTYAVPIADYFVDQILAFPI